MIRAAALGFAIFAALMWGVARGEVRQEVLELPVLCGPMRELESLILQRGAVWIARGTTPVGKAYYYINKKEGEFYAIRPIGDTHCLDFDRLEDIRVSRNPLINYLSD